MKLSPGRRVRLSLLAATLIALVAGGIAYASIPDSNGVIHGCYNPNGSTATGGTQLNVLDTAVASCKANQQAIVWDQSTDAYTQEMSEVIPGDSNLYSLGTMSVPEGSFVVNVKNRIVLAAASSTIVTCIVFENGFVILEGAGDTTVDPAHVAQLPLLGRAVVQAGSGPATLEVKCRSTDESVGIDSFVVATKIGTIHDQ